MIESRVCALGFHYECEGTMCDCSCHPEIAQEAADAPTWPSTESRRWEVLQLVVRHGGYPSLHDELKALKAYEKFLETGDID